MFWLQGSLYPGYEHRSDGERAILRERERDRQIWLAPAVPAIQVVKQKSGTGPVHPDQSSLHVTSAPTSV